MSEDHPSGRPPEHVESQGVAQRQHNFRAEPALMREVREEAKRQGMNSSEFIREALMFRLGVLARERGEAIPEVEALLRKLSSMNGS